MDTNTESTLKIGLVLDSSLDLEDGVQQYVMTMGEWLRSQGHDVHYLVGQTEHRQLPNIHSLARNIVVKFNGNRINLPLTGNGRKIKALLHDEAFDVLYVQTPFHPLMAQRIILAAPKSAAVVGSFNILPNSRFVAMANKLLRILVRPALRRMDKMLAVSPAAAVYEKQVFGLDADVSPNVFRYHIFQTAAPLEKYQDNVPTILFLGRLVPRKGCMKLLEAVSLLSKEGDVPNFRVVVCGKGPLDQELRQYCQANGLTDVVEFVGYVSDEDKPRYYASADIAAFPSSGGESFGIVLLEAMASGKAAVLAGNNPGYRTVMEPRPDTLFDPHSARELADKLRELLTNDMARQQSAQWGGQYSRDFDVEAVGQELQKLFQDLYRQKNMQ
jgi:phosphatidylinositol alpha-mannosyltransferase